METAPKFSPSFARRVLAAVCLAVFVAGTVWLLGQFVQVLLFIFGGVLLALFLEGITCFLVRHTGVWRPVSLGVVLLVLSVLLAAVCWFVGPRVASELQALSGTLPQGLANLEQQVRGSWAGPLFADTPSMSKMLPAPSTLFSDLRGLLSTAGTVAAMAVFVVFLGIYAAAEPDTYLASLLHLVPIRKRDRCREVIGLLVHALRRWIAGRMVVMVLMGVLTFLGLWLLGVPMALSLGIMAGLFQFVPYLGSITAAIPALLIAFTHGPGLAFAVGLLYVGVHLTEGYGVTPLIQRRAVALPPAALLAMQVILGTLCGLPGVLFASPLAVALIILVQTLYVQDTLGDPVPVLGNEH